MCGVVAASGEVATPREKKAATSLRRPGEHGDSHVGSPTRGPGSSPLEGATPDALLLGLCSASSTRPKGPGWMTHHDVLPAKLRSMKPLAFSLLSWSFTDDGAIWSDFPSWRHPPSNVKRPLRNSALSTMAIRTATVRGPLLRPNAARASMTGCFTWRPLAGGQVESLRHGRLPAVADLLPCERSALAAAPGSTALFERLECPLRRLSRSTARSVYRRIPGPAAGGLELERRLGTAEEDPVRRRTYACRTTCVHDRSTTMCRNSSCVIHRGRKNESTSERFGR